MQSFIRSSGRVVSRIPRRSYATSRPTLPEGSGNKPYMIAALVGIPALVYFMIPSRPAPSGASTAAGTTRRPNLDPAAAKRAREERELEHHGERKYMHPEHRNPEDYKVPFGQIHKAKRVDEAPDGRNHQSLSERARVY
ncbi:hypothetical protein GQX73_g8425 [Xylaria multiplex]|uniref:Uncharacterized protein n=1 Tax=Xylaria multiplex TaxID=323545 RepID=A0A7C8N2Q4_9PEZI|nr:hypothetical protein GQX73_g8425 [Xylaria multiplex]